MSIKLGDLHPSKLAFAEYMARWYTTVYGDTKATEEFASRGAAKAIKLVAGRMIDDVKAMLDSYQRDQQGEHGANSKLPIVFVALARDYTTTGGDWGGRQVSRRLVRLADGDDASVYGLRLAMHDVRAQVVVMAADEGSARSLAAQLGLFVGDIANRRFTAKHEFGQYTIPAPIVIENPDLMFGSAGESKTMTILIADLTLKVSMPYLDAPKQGEENDGTANVPPGYPVVTSVAVRHLDASSGGLVDESGTHWGELQ